MTVVKEDVLNEIDDLVTALENPLPADELANGWTPQSQAATLSLLAEMRNILSEDGKLPYANMGRGLDHWGVESGPLFEQVCVVSDHLSELRELGDG